MGRKRIRNRNRRSRRNRRRRYSRRRRRERKRCRRRKDWDVIPFSLDTVRNGNSHTSEWLENHIENNKTI